MPDFTKRVRRKLDLPEGERVVQAAVAQPSGSISRGFAEKHTAFGAVSSALKHKRDDRSDEHSIADRIPKRNGYLVVTDQRVIWADQNKTGSVGEVIDHFAFADVTAVNLGEGGGVSNELLSLTFVDQSSIGLAVAKGQKPGRLYAALAAAIATAT